MPSVDVGLTLTAINNASGAINSVGGDVKRLGDNAQATSNRLKAIQVVIAGILFEKTIEWTKKLVEAAAATQNLDLRMAGFAGTAQAAQKIWADLATTFAATPIKMETISQSWIKLRAVMSSNDQATTVIKAIGNAVLALGGSDENINNVSSAFQRMFATGISSAREYKTILQQTGLTLGDLAKAAGTSAQTIATELKKGFLTAQQFTDMFVKAANERFGFFAQNLKNSIGGAYNLIANTISKGISELGAKTDINARVTVFFQNVAHAIDEMIKSIDQSKIDELWNWFKKIEPAVRNVVIALLHVGTALLTVGASIAALLAKMPADATEYGIVGYMLFGKKGALMGANLGASLDALKNTKGTSLNAFGGNVWQNASVMTDKFKSMGENDVVAHIEGAWVAMFGGIARVGSGAIDTIADHAKKMLGAGGAAGEKSIFGTQADWDKAIKHLDDFIKKMGTASAATQTTGVHGPVNDWLEQALRLTPQLADAFKTVGDRIQEMKAKIAGDEDAVAFQQIKLAGDSIIKQIDSQIKAEAALKIHTAENLALVKGLLAEKAAIPGLVDQQIAKEQVLKALLHEQFGLQQMLLQMQNHFAAMQLDMSSNSNPLFNMMQGTSGGQSVLQTLQQQQQLQEQLVNLSAQRVGLETQLKNAVANSTDAIGIQNTIHSLDELSASTKNALANLSAEGQMTKQLWKDLAQTMENDIANGLTGLIEGTMTLGDVMRQVFGDMISLGIKFLLQLVEIQLFGQLAQTASLAAMAPAAAAASAMWGPAAIAASIATFGGADAVGVAAYQAALATSLVPFADGGVPGLPSNSIVTGPTLFGMAGEAGDEAIMPLTRIGGKLGVRAEGGGGAHYHFHSADPESNVKFFMQNLPLIQAGLAQRGRLNK